jgi:hypothetical protein
MQILQASHSNSLDIAKFNLAAITLVADAITIKKFRPISLVNCSYKLITKVLTSRLTTVIDSLMDSSQTAATRLVGLYFLIKLLLMKCYIRHELGKKKSYPASNY